MPRDALFSMQYLFPMLYENDVDFKIILSSEFDWNTYKDYNIIYIGAFKNLHSLSILIDKLNIKYDNIDHIISWDSKGEEKLYIPEFMSNKNIDYVLVAKLRGTNGNVIHLFVSDNDIGCIEAAKRFTTLDSINYFENNTLEDATYFKSIFKAEGIIRTSVTFDLVDCEVIRDSTLSDFWHY